MNRAISQATFTDFFYFFLLVYSGVYIGNVSFDNMFIFIVIIFSAWLDWNSSQVSEAVSNRIIFCFFDIANILNYFSFLNFITRMDLTIATYRPFCHWVIIFLIYISWNSIILIKDRCDAETKKFFLLYIFIESLLIAGMVIYYFNSFSISNEKAYNTMAAIHLSILISWLYLTYCRKGTQ